MKSLPQYLVLIILLVFVACSEDDDPVSSNKDNGAENDTTPPAETYEDIVEDYIVEYTNDFRVEAGLTALEHDELLSSVARDHSLDMLERDFFSHINPDGENPWDRVIDVDERSVSTVGENIWFGTGYGTENYSEEAEIIVNSWMNSEGHRANILNDNFTHIGVGVALEGTSVRATQVFAGFH